MREATTVTNVIADIVQIFLKDYKPNFAKEDSPSMKFATTVKKSACPNLAGETED